MSCSILETMSETKVVIIGAGAAGYFCALNLAKFLKEAHVQAKITIVEKAASGLRKVRISGGGRCNVTHHEFDPKVFLKNYPRGHRQLRSPLYEFGAQETIQWFKERGVKLKVEEDGRMFPVTNSSQTIIDCFQNEAQKYGIEVLYKAGISAISHKQEEGMFTLTCANNEEITCTHLCMATGSDRSGHDLAKSLGHKITQLAPSLFTFKSKHPLLTDLAGTSFQNAEVKIPKLKLCEQGPLLITHWGLSGPAILKLSAWGARELKELNYNFDYRVNFLGIHFDEAKQTLTHFRKANIKKQLGTLAPFEACTQKFWERILSFHQINPKGQWANLSQKELNKIATSFTAQEFKSLGPHRHKEEFVECGGIDSREIDFNTMQSKLIKGLYFSGELLDIDGITGGFNFQNAWSTSFKVAQALAQDLIKNKR